jgi:hypothetical protein
MDERTSLKALVQLSEEEVGMETRTLGSSGLDVSARLDEKAGATAVTLTPDDLAETCGPRTPPRSKATATRHTCSKSSTADDC